MCSANGRSSMLCGCPIAICQINVSFIERLALLNIHNARSLLRLKNDWAVSIRCSSACGRCLEAVKFSLTIQSAIIVCLHSVYSYMVYMIINLTSYYYFMHPCDNIVLE